MPHLEVEVLYQINGTTCTDIFTCEHAERTMLPQSTSIVFTGGTEKGTGRPVNGVMYRDAQRVMTYLIDA